MMHFRVCNVRIYFYHCFNVIIYFFLSFLKIQICVLHTCVAYLLKRAVNSTSKMFEGCAREPFRLSSSCSMDRTCFSWWTHIRTATALWCDGSLCFWRRWCLLNASFWARQRAHTWQSNYFPSVWIGVAVENLIRFHKWNLYWFSGTAQLQLHTVNKNLAQSRFICMGFSFSLAPCLFSLFTKWQIKLIRTKNGASEKKKPLEILALLWMPVCINYQPRKRGSIEEKLQQDETK